MDSDLENERVIERVDGQDVVYENEVVKDNKLLNQKYL